MGGSMNTPCPKCNGDGLTDEGRKAKRAERVEKAVDDAYERNRYNKFPEGEKV